MKKLTLRERLTEVEQELRARREQLTTAERALSFVLARDVRAKKAGRPHFSPIQRQELHNIFLSLHVKTKSELIDAELRNHYAPLIAKMLNSPSLFSRRWAKR